MLQTQVMEGTWEEVQRGMERLAREHAGERVRLIVVPEPRVALPGEPERPGEQKELSPEERICILDSLAERNRNLPVLQPEAFERESLYDDRW